LQAGARVHDALQKAGGLLPDAESKSINQAQKLTDEAVVYVAKVGEEGADVTQTSQTPAGNGARTGLVVAAGDGAAFLGAEGGEKWLVGA